MKKLVACIILLLPLPLAASPGPGAGKGISIRLFAAALAGPQKEACFMAEETRGPAFRIPDQNLSAEILVTSRDLLLVPAAASPSDPKPLAKIQLPEQGNDFRIILVPAKDGTYQPVVIRGDDPAFTRGDVFFINLSSSEMLGTLGSARVALKPGKNDTIRLTGAKDNSYFEVKFARREEQALRPVADTRWPILRNNRSYLIFFNGKNGKPAYRAVDEFLEPATASL